MDSATKSLEAAVPAMLAAIAAVDCLKVAAVVEFMSFSSPPPGAEIVPRAIQILKGVTNKKQLVDWPAQQKMMKPPQGFIDSLRSFDKDNITDK